MATNPNAVFPAHNPTAHFSFPKAEEDVLAYWKEIDAFQESIRQSEGKPQYSFYDGPPFATGLPHHGHILMGTVKDIVTRYAHSNGFYVERRFGWDTHGLPVEHEIDKKLNITSVCPPHASAPHAPSSSLTTWLAVVVHQKADVMAMGIDKYNAECRAIVMRYSSEWRKTVERLGRWIDFDNDYKTLNTPYMESVWWVFGQLWKKNLVYRGMRVMPYTTGCTTPLSNFEAQQAYKDVQDPAVTVAFTLESDPTVSVLAWTTTPWTLPSNLALCVHPDFTYVTIHHTDLDRKFILCDKLLTALFKDPVKAAKEKKYTVLESTLGKDLVGLKYTPMFPYFVERFGHNCFKIIADKYVTADSGTGVVHQAPAFGEDDHRIAIREKFITKEEMPPCPIDERGMFTSEVPDYEGQYIKDADKNIMKVLKERKVLIAASQLMHSYPFCWRSGTPLIYRVVPAWFVRVEGSNDQLVKNNLDTTWVPASVSTTRFQNWLQNARDWNVSRNRYWGTPLPLWANEDYSEIVCIGSIEELDKLSGCGTLLDIHRDKIDHITIPSKDGKGVLRRVEEVFDCWFESGSMPYAQAHYPFENKEKFEASFPADFISEAMDQTRGWFYTLLVLSTHLFDTAPWKNLIVCGHVLAADGKKMSKSLKNYPDPNLIVDKYGADALRLFLVNSPVVRGDSLRFKEEGVKEVIARVLLPFLNSYRFFVGQAALLKKESGVDFKYDPVAPKSENVMDRWILASCQSLIAHVKTEMEGESSFEPFVMRVTDLMALLQRTASTPSHREPFCCSTTLPTGKYLPVALAEVGSLCQLLYRYIRFNRRRLKGEQGVQDTVAALQTLFEALLTLARTLSSFIPFLTEIIYQGLRVHFPDDTSSLGVGEDVRSLHFLPFPTVREEYFDPIIERQASRLKDVIELGRVVRERNVIPLKIPLKELIVFHPTLEYLEDVKLLLPYVEQELNVRQVTFTTDETLCGIKYKATADIQVLGKKLKKDIGKVKGGLPKLTSEEVKAYLVSGKISVGGIELVAGDLTALRYCELPPREADAATHLESNTNNDVVVLLDVKRHPELESEGLAREVVNRIQRLRKSAGLVPTDDIDVFYHFADEDTKEGQELHDCIVAQQDVFVRVLKRVPLPKAHMNAGQGAVVTEEVVEVGDLKVTLTLVRA